jgi:hypothetical protein
MQYVAFCFWLVLLMITSLRFIHIVVSALCSFLLPNNNPLCGYIYCTLLSFCQSLNIWVVSSWFLWTLCTIFCVNIYFQFPREIARKHGNTMFNILRNYQIVFQSSYFIFTIPLAMYEVFNFPVSLLTLVIFYLFGIGILYGCGCKMISHCGFDLYFPSE